MMTRLARSGDPFLRTTDDLARWVDAMTSIPRIPVRSWVAGVPFPPLNLLEGERRYLVEAELPGMTIDDLEIFVEEGTLTIRGRRVASTPEGAAVIRRERLSGEFERSVDLPKAVDAEQIEATLQNGILRITMAKEAKSLPRRIAVQAVENIEETPLECS